MCTCHVCLFHPVPEICSAEEQVDAQRNGASEQGDDLQDERQGAFWQRCMNQCAEEGHFNHPHGRICLDVHWLAGLVDNLQNHVSNLGVVWSVGL